MEQHGRQNAGLVDRHDLRATALRSRELRSVAFQPALDAVLLARFERALEDTVGALLETAGDSPVAEHVRWHFGIGCAGASRRGKRLRPRALLQTALEEGATFDQALDAALAVEYLHNYSLVHDDVEDADELRHGRQAVWSRYGLAHGVNAGDALCALTYSTLLRNGGGLPLERVVEMSRVLHRANLAMCAGQGYDLAFESAAHVTMDAYLAMVDGKAAVLFGAACELGAICAGADRRRAAAYGELGRCCGRAFQIHDDVAGAWSSSDQTGKPRGSDLARRKWTFPVVWALGGPPSEERTAIAARYASAEPLAPRDVEAVAGALDALGARRAAEDACRALLRDAERIARRHGLDRSGGVRALFGASRTSEAIA